MSTRPSSSDDLENQTPKKRIRLSHACNLCRSRKVRCDEQEHSCRNCELAGVECITTDPRSAIGAQGLRRRAGPAVAPRAYDAITDRVQYPSGMPRGDRTSSLESHVDIQPESSILSRRLAAVEQQIEQLHSKQNFSFPSPAASQSQPRAQDKTIRQPTRSLENQSQNDLLPSQITDFTHGIAHRVSGANGPDVSIAAQPVNTLSSSQDTLDVLTGTTQGAFHEDNSAFRRKWVGPSSLHVLTQWLDLSSTIYGGKPVSSMFSFGMEHAEEMPLPFPIIGSNGFAFLPPIEERNEYINTFFRHVHPLFPVLDIENFWTQLSKFNWLSRQSENGSFSPIQPIPPSDRPLLATIYAMVSVGADEKANEYTELGEVYLTAAFSMYAHLAAMPYLPSVQALLLLTIALRARTKDGCAWQTHSQAIRIAQSLGLHRYRHGSFSRNQDPELDARVWWTAYCLEKVMSFETGRSSMIEDEDCNQNLPKSYNTSYYEDGCEITGPDCFAAFIGLAKVQSAISKRLFRQSSNGRTPGQVLHENGELDQLLLTWLESVPPDIRPGRELFCAPSIYPFAIFLALQHHQTLSMLHRPGLLLDTQFLQQQVMMHCADMPWRHRLKASEAICAGSARAVIRILTEDRTEYHQSRLLVHALTPLLLAVYVLAIIILKHPQAKLVHNDLLLLTSAAQHVKARYISAGQHPEFYRMVEVLCQLASERVSDPFTRPVSPMNQIPHQVPLSANSLDEITWDYPFQLDPQDPQMFEELWSRVLGEDLAVSPFVNDTNASLEATYQIFGLLPPRQAPEYLIRE